MYEDESVNACSYNYRNLIMEMRFISIILSYVRITSLPGLQHRVQRVRLNSFSDRRVEFSFPRSWFPADGRARTINYSTTLLWPYPLSHISTRYDDDYRRCVHLSDTWRGTFNTGRHALQAPAPITLPLRIFSQFPLNTFVHYVFLANKIKILN